jgi:hypothetical protein
LTRNFLRTAYAGKTQNCSNAKVADNKLVLYTAFGENVAVLTQGKPRLNIENIRIYLQGRQLGAWRGSQWSQSPPPHLTSKNDFSGYFQ